MITRRTLLGTMACMPVAICPAVSLAQLPGMVSIVVPAATGGALDNLTRLVAQKLQPVLGSTVVVENRPGANAVVGTTYVSKADTNGGLLLLADRTTVAVNPLLYSKLPYDANAITGISDIAKLDFFFVVRSGAPYKTWEEMAAFARANPGKISVGTPGTGSAPHLSMELVGRSIGAKFTHVPYRGMGPAVNDILGGNIDAVIMGPEVWQHISGGRIRVLASGAEKRAPLLPDTPTLRELGFTEPLLLPTTFALFAPTGTSDAKLDMLNAAIRKVMADPDLIARFEALYIQPVASSPADVQKDVAQLRDRMAKVIREVGVTLD